MECTNALYLRCVRGTNITQNTLGKTQINRCQTVWRPRPLLSIVRAPQWNGIRSKYTTQIQTYTNTKLDTLLSGGPLLLEIAVLPPIQSKLLFTYFMNRAVGLCEFIAAKLICADCLYIYLVMVFL